MVRRTWGHERIRRTILAAVPAIAIGCIFVTEPWTFEDDTPVVAFNGGDGYPKAAFGAAIASGTFVESGVMVAHLAVSAGIRSPTLAYSFPVEGPGSWSLDVDSEICKPLGDLLTDGTVDETCDQAGAGTALLWLPRFFAGGAIRSPCLAIGEITADGVGAATEDLGRVAVYCGETILEFAARVDGPAWSPAGFGRAMALMRSAGADRLLVSAMPAVESATVRAIGEVYVSGGASADPSAPAGGAFTRADALRIGSVGRIDSPGRIDGYGVALAAGATSNGEGYAAVGAAGPTGLDPSRLYLFRPERPRDPRSPLAVAACVEGPAGSALGTAMIAGDLDGDGNDELLVRAPDGVSIYEGAVLAALVPRPDPYDLAGCAAFAAVPDSAGPVRVQTIRCAPIENRGVECSAAFGATLAMGDVDGDGATEILVGDPDATVGGAGRAGAVHVVKLDGAAFVPRTVGALRDAVPESGQRLGAAIAVVRGAGRDEPFVGAPGSNETFAFYCTGIQEDRPGDPGLDARCRPR